MVEHYSLYFKGIVSNRSSFIIVKSRSLNFRSYSFFLLLLHSTGNLQLDLRFPRHPTLILVVYGCEATWKW